MTASTKSYQIEFDIIALPAARPNVMDLKIFHAPARLATPTVSLQDFAAKLAISLWIKLQAWSFGTHSSQSVTCTFFKELPYLRLGKTEHQPS